MNEPKVVEGIPVGTACPRTEVDLSPFIDCLQALVARDYPNLEACVGVLAYRLVLGDIVKRAD